MVASGVAPIVIELVRQSFLIQLDAQARAVGIVHVTVFGDEWLLEITLAERDMLLGDEIGDGGVQLDAGCQ